MRTLIYHRIRINTKMFELFTTIELPPLNINSNDGMKQNTYKIQKNNVTCSQFHQHIMNGYFVNFHLQKITNANCKHLKALQNYFVQKSCSQNVGDIDTWSRNHQHFMCSFYTHRSQKDKKYSQVISLFCAFGICTNKTCL